MNTTEETKQALSKAIKAAGTQSALAALIAEDVRGKRGGKIMQAHVNKWASAGRVPAEYVLSIEKHTGVKRHELRPDIYPPDEYKDCCPCGGKGAAA